MHRIIRILTFFLILLTAKSFATPWFQFSIFSPNFQLYSPETDISGLRIGLFYAHNKNVGGADLTVFVARTAGDFKGFGFGIVNLVDGRFHGGQLGVLNRTGAKSVGLQMGVANLNQEISGGRFGTMNFSQQSSGFEIGIVNVGHKVSGFQLGVINYAEHLEGLQIGILNIAANSSLFEVLPIFNFRF